MDEHGYSEELANDELYCFGVEYGDGSDEDNFHFKGIYEHLVRAALITGIVLLGFEVKSKLTIKAARIKGGKKIELSVSVDEEFVFLWAILMTQL